MHPSTRAERRAQRERVIVRRVFIWTHIWRILEDYKHHKWDLPDRGRYAKFNLNCGCKMCHSAKYFGEKSRRRYLRKHAESPADCRNGDRKIS